MFVVCRELGFGDEYQHVFNLDGWPDARYYSKACVNAGKPGQYERYCREKADTQLHIVGMTQRAHHVRGYWDFETTKDPKTKKPLHYGFHLDRAEVVSGKSMKYLSINAGRYHDEKSDVAIAEFIMYKGALDDSQVKYLFLHAITLLLIHSLTHPLSHSSTICFIL